MGADASRLLESGNYADLRICCSDVFFDVHCAIVCTRSLFFAKAVAGPFKVCSLSQPTDSTDQVQESISREIDLSADEVPVVRAMIRYLYTDNYNEGDLEDLSELDGQPVIIPAIFNVKLYIVGDKYDIPGLQTLATRKYIDSLAGEWDSATFCRSALLLWENTMDSDR